MSSVDVSSLSLFPATPAQVLEARRRVHLQWGQGLTLEEHMERESAYDQYDCAQDGKMRCW